MPKILIICILAMLSITSSASAKAENVFPIYECKIFHQSIVENAVSMDLPPIRSSAPFIMNFNKGGFDNLFESPDYITAFIYWIDSNSSWLFDKKNNRLVTSFTAFDETTDGISTTTIHQVSDCEASP